MFCTYDSYDSDEGMVELSIRDFWLLVGGLFWVAGEPLCRDVCVCECSVKNLLLFQLAKLERFV